MKLEDTIEIDATRDRVWAVTIDLENWPLWTPTVDSVKRLDQGPLEPGSAANIKQPGMPRTRWVVTDLDAGRRFAWQTRVLGMSMVATHEIESNGSRTRNTLRLEVRGVVATLLWPLLRPAMARALAQENSGLKSYCESQERAPS